MLFVLNEGCGSAVFIAALNLVSLLKLVFGYFATFLCLGLPAEELEVSLTKDEVLLIQLLFD